MAAELTVDVMLAAGSVLLALLTLLVRQVFTSIVLYISFGLLVTIVWVRLNAWDVAIAEAAIGAGLTGSLLLVAWRALTSPAGFETGQRPSCGTGMEKGNGGNNVH